VAKNKNKNKLKVTTTTTSNNEMKVNIEKVSTACKGFFTQSVLSVRRYEMIKQNRQQYSSSSSISGFRQQSELYM